jgi:hypothetical protein
VRENRRFARRAGVSMTARAVRQVGIGMKITICGCGALYVEVAANGSDAARSGHRASFTDAALIVGGPAVESLGGYE